jgi:type VI secretion system protein ImpF
MATNPSGYRTGLVPSILDRLIESGEGEGKQDLINRGQTLSELEESVRRDLQDLLNTRRLSEDGFPEESELACSLLTYGLPEITGLNPSVPDQLKRLQDVVETTIRRFEPRLMNVRVVSLNADAASGRGLRMSVEALLRLDPSPVPVAFDTVIESGTGNWSVVEGRGG